MKYFIVKKKHNNEERTYTSYGIMYGNIKDGEICVKRIVWDISTDLEEIRNLVRLCNRKKLSILHLDDVIYDFLE